MDQIAPRPSEELFTCAGRSSCLLTVTTVQLSSGSRVTLMLATVVVVVRGFCVSVFLCCLGVADAFTGVSSESSPNYVALVFVLGFCVSP